MHRGAWWATVHGVAEDLEKRQDADPDESFVIGLLRLLFVPGSFAKETPPEACVDQLTADPRAARLMQLKHVAGTCSDFASTPRKRRLLANGEGVNLSGKTLALWKLRAHCLSLTPPC